MAFVRSMLVSVVTIMLCCWGSVSGQEGCSGPLDLTFMVDRSASICATGIYPTPTLDGMTCDNWKQVIDLILDTVDQMEIAPDKVRVAMVVFGYYGNLIWDLMRYSDVDELKEGISSLEFRPELTNTSGGLMVAYNEVFDLAKGDRPGAPNIVIALTDGDSTVDEVETIPAAEALRADKHVAIFAVGVGVTKRIDVDELKGLSSNPQVLGKNYYMSADDIVETLVDHACEPIEATICNKLDLAFLVDRSGSICDDDPNERRDADGRKTCDNWEFIIQFIKDFISDFTISSDDVRVALATFGNNGKLYWDLDDYGDIDSVNQAIGEIPFMYQHTNTSGGLKVIYHYVFSGTGGDRADVSNVLIVLTDGVSTYDHDETVPWAEKLRDDKDVAITTVGVTDLINEEELMLMSSEPQLKNQNYFMTDNFDSLSELLWATVTGSCN